MKRAARHAFETGQSSSTAVLNTNERNSVPSFIVSSYLVTAKCAIDEGPTVKGDRLV